MHGTNVEKKSLYSQVTMMPNIFIVVPTNFRSLFHHFFISKHEQLQLYHADF
jgi:hypothetical protein